MSRCVRQTRSALAFGSTIVLTIGALAVSCGQGSTVVVERTLEGTVALSTERTLLVDSTVKVVVDGTRRQNDITYELVATITASTSETASRAADRISVGLDRPENAIRLKVGAPIAGTIGGVLRISAPSDLDLGVFERGTNVDVTGMEGDIQIDSASSVLVVDPRRTVSIAVQSGNVLIDSSLPSGERTEVVVGTGDIQLTVPVNLSASIDATAGGGGAVAIGHSQLPQPQPGQRYVANVNGGLNTVVLSTRRGNVVVRAP